MFKVIAESVLGLADCCPFLRLSAELSDPRVSGQTYLCWPSHVTLWAHGTRPMNSLLDIGSSLIPVCTLLLFVSLEFHFVQRTSERILWISIFLGLLAFEKHSRSERQNIHNTSTVRSANNQFQTSLSGIVNILCKHRLCSSWVLCEKGVI